MLRRSHIAKEYRRLFRVYSESADTPYKEEYHYALSSVENAYFRSFRSRAPGIITPEEVRANATIAGLKQLDEFGIPCAPRVRDEFRIIPKRDWKDAIDERRKLQAENKYHVKYILRQSYNSCASESLTGALMSTEVRQGNEKVELLNPLPLYRLVNGGRDAGSSLSDNISAAAKYGIPSEKAWPYSKGWRKKPSDAAMQDALRHRPLEYFRVSDNEEFGTALLLNFFVYFGYSGHAIYACDLVDTRRFYYVNSWGKDFGNNGIGTLSFSSIYWPYGAWAIRTTIRPS